MPELLSAGEVTKLNEYWFAANYRTVRQIYLRDNPLLERPLSRDDIKPRLLGYWGTTARELDRREETRQRHSAFVMQYREDLPEVRHWKGGL